MEFWLLVLAVGAWLIVRSKDRAATRERFAAQDQELGRLREMIYELQKPNPASTDAPATPGPAPGPREAEPAYEPFVYTASSVASSPAPPPAPAPPAVAMAEYLARTRTVAPKVEPAIDPEEVQKPARDLFAPSPPPPPPISSPEPPQLSLEQTLGANWLNRLGIALLVFGVALYLAYEVTHFGPLGKVVTAFAVAGVMLGGGLWLERKEQYRIFARAGIGGGWALAFLTTYAMYFFPATQVLHSQSFDLVLLLLVGLGMVAHSLRYRSQVVTGLAFLLAFSTVTISQVSAFSLLASAVLALGLEFVCVREAWYGLEIAGVIAAYGNHFLWLERTLAPFGGSGHAFPLWGESTALLLLFWAIFRVGYCVRRPPDEAGEGISGLVAILNSAGILGLMKYQSFHPEYAFRALLALGAAEIALAFFMRSRRRPAFAVLVTVASVLLVAAVPFRFGGATWPIVWVLEGEALFLCGLFLRERILRWLGLLTHLVVVGQLLVIHGDVAFGAVRGDWRWVMAAFFLVAAAMWFNAEGLGRREAAEEGEPYRALLLLSSFAASLCACLGLRIAMLGWPLALVWALLALALVEVGLRRRSLGLRVQGYGVLVAAMLRLAVFNFAGVGLRGFGDTRLWVGVGLVAACVGLHLRLRAAGAEQVHGEERGPVADAALWCASAIAMALLYLELPQAWVAVGWAALALVLLEAGLRERSFMPRLQAYVGLSGAIGWLVLVNFAAGGARGLGEPRLWAGLSVIAGCVLVQERLRAADDFVPASERTYVLGAALWCASALASALLYLELPERWLAAGWAGFALALASFALVRDSARLRSKALLLVAMAVARAVLLNLAPAWAASTQANLGPDWGRVAFFVAVGLLLAGVPVGFRLRERLLAESANPSPLLLLLRRPEQMYFFAALLLLALWVPVDFHHGTLTMGWSTLGVAVFLVALAAGERSFRLAGLGLLLLGVAKLLVVDVWGLAPTERYLLLIGVGIALLLVSFLYSRFADRLKEYL